MEVLETIFDILLVGIKGNKLINKIIIGLSTFILLLSLFTGGLFFLFKNGIIIAFITFIIYFILGLIFGVKISDQKAWAEQYQKIFETIKLISMDNYAPVLVKEIQNEYVIALVFYSKIPLEEWKKKKDLLEVYLNSRIIKIDTADENNNLTCVYIEKEQLPKILYWNDSYMTSDSKLTLGRCHLSTTTFDLNVNAHTFIAGETGSGKSNIMKTLIYQCLVKEYEVILIDFKRGVSFAVFDKFVEIYSDYEKIEIVLRELVNETNKRLDLLRENHVEDIKGYNELENRYMGRIVLFIDELAELIKTSDKETTKRILNYLETLTRLSRAVGINLIMGLQRPDSTIITGQIKNNVSLRICGRFVDPEPSRIMLGNDMASKLPNIKGRFILKDGEYKEFQAFYITDDKMKLLKYKITLIEKQEINDIEILDLDNEDDTTPINEPKIDFNYDDIL